jgi:hypothetical protein
MNKISGRWLGVVFEICNLARGETHELFDVLVRVCLDLLFDFALVDFPPLVSLSFQAMVLSTDESGVQEHVYAL